MTNMPQRHNHALPPISELVMHAKPMLLIDRAMSADETSLTAEVDITANSMFCVPNKGVPSYVGIEYIAQTVAAYSGWRAKTLILTRHQVSGTFWDRARSRYHATGSLSAAPCRFT